MTLAYLKNDTVFRVYGNPASNFPATTGFGLPQGIVSANNFGLTGSRPGLAHYPFHVYRPMTITDAQFQIRATASVTFDIYLQDADENWQPVSGTSRTIITGVTATAGVNQVTGLAFLLDPGRYLTTIVYGGDANLSLTHYGVSLPDFPSVVTGNAQNGGSVLRALATSNKETPWSVPIGLVGGGIGNAVLYRWVYE